MSWTGPSAIVLPPDLVYIEGGLQGTVTLNATNTRVAWLFRALSSGNIQSVYIRTNTVTSSQSLKVGIQSVASGDPTGTWLGATATGYGTIATPASSTTYNVSLSESVAQTAETIYALVVEWTSTTGTVAVVVQDSTVGVPTQADNSQYRLTYTSGAWVKTVTSAGATNGLAFGIKTDGASWWLPFCAMPWMTSGIVNSGSYGSSSTPDEHGNKLTLPAGNLVGLWVASDLDGAADIVCYDNAGSVVKSVSLDPAQRALTSYANFCVRFPGIAIAEGTYRIIMKPTTTTTVTRFLATYDSSQDNGRSMGTNCCHTSRTDAGAWTDTAAAQMVIGTLVEPTIGGGSASSRMVNVRGGADQ